MALICELLPPSPRSAAGFIALMALTRGPDTKELSELERPVRKASHVGPGPGAVDGTRWIAASIASRTSIVPASIRWTSEVAVNVLARELSRDWRLLVEGPFRALSASASPVGGRLAKVDNAEATIALARCAVAAEPAPDSKSCER